MENKRDNFKRISRNRTDKIVELISKLNNLSNTSFYEYTEEEIHEVFDRIQSELDRQKEYFLKISNKEKKVKL